MSTPTTTTDPLPAHVVGSGLPTEPGYYWFRGTSIARGHWRLVRVFRPLWVDPHRRDLRWEYIDGSGGWGPKYDVSASAGVEWSRPVLPPTNTDVPTATGTGYQPEQAISCAAREGMESRGQYNKPSAAPTGETGIIDAPAGPPGPVGFQSPNTETADLYGWFGIDARRPLDGQVVQVRTAGGIYEARYYRGAGFVSWEGSSELVTAWRPVPPPNTD